MSTVSTPWIKTVIARNDSDRLRQEARKAREDADAILVQCKGLDFWQELCRELQVQGKDCAHLGVSICSKFVPDPRGKEASCLRVTAVRDSPTVIDAYLRLSYRKGERLIILYRTPPQRTEGEEALKILLAASIGGQVVAYYFNEPFSPYGLAEELLKFLIRRLDPSQLPETDEEL